MSSENYSEYLNIHFVPSPKKMAVFERIDEARFVSADGQRHYHIQVGVPLKSVRDKRQKLPVFAMLDGRAVFDELSEYPQELAPDAFIIGVGYDATDHVIKANRAFDYTPPIQGHPDLHDPRIDSYNAGGAEVFLDLLQKYLLPEIFRRYEQADSERKLFYGHSYGGLCVLHTLFTHTALFEHWVAASPSLWWHDHFILKEARSFAQNAHMQANISLHLVAGDKERFRLRQEDVSGILTMHWLQELTMQLAGAENLDIELTYFERADHHGAFRDSIRYVIHLSRSTPFLSAFF